LPIKDSYRKDKKEGKRVRKHSESRGGLEMKRYKEQE
jgi:hypothetical protein